MIADDLVSETGSTIPINQKSTFFSSEIFEGVSSAFLHEPLLQRVIFILYISYKQIT